MYKNGLISDKVAIWLHFDFDTSTKETRKEDKTVKYAWYLIFVFVFYINKCAL